MNIEVFPQDLLKGSLLLPASKSYSVRAFMIASCGGKSRIINPSTCDDALAAIAVARQLGAVIKEKNAHWEVIARQGKFNRGVIDVKESGTVLRMLLPLVALHNETRTVTGQGTLRGRPNHHLIQTLQKLGVNVSGHGENHSIPIKFKGGALRGGEIRIEGSLSSQFVSALLIACPQLLQDSIIKVMGRKIVSTDYILMTLQMLDRVGIDVRRKGFREYRIRGGQQFKGLSSFHVPSDYGLAAFMMAAAALTTSKVVLKGELSDDLIQADGHIFSILNRMGVVFQKTSRRITMKGPFQLRGGEFSLKDCPDLLPILSVLALFADKPSKFYHVAHARSKESDRISDLRHELLKIAAKIEEGRDFLKVYPLKETECKHGKFLNPHKDHRLAMAFTVLGLKIGTKVKDVECVAKSYPDFFHALASLGVKIKNISSFYRK
ncbi:MAG: 3-phosphoshikimate 1-carboxyvinyltransferase [Candidatus Omnitrophota bacterium]